MVDVADAAARAATLPARGTRAEFDAALGGEIACVDLETTGGSGAFHRIIEIGIVTLSGGEIVDEWSSLVNPQTRIPSAIAAFTGIDDDMVARAPRFAALADDVRARLEGKLFVAHNVRFDYGFLRQEYRRLGQPFRSRVLCSVKLSRRLHPGLHGHGLDAVMARHGLDCSARHRAQGDARVVAEFLRLMRRCRDHGELAGIVDELTGEAALPPTLDADFVEELPESPGVYRFWGEGDALLYVGKSRNLRTRVLYHFAAAHRSVKDQRLAAQVRRIDWTETPGEFSALLLELGQIRELRPLANRRSRPAPEAMALQLVPRGEGIVAELAPLAATADFTEVYGVFRSERDAKRALVEIVRAQRLCARVLGIEAGDGACFAHAVGRCKGACIGAEPRALHDARVRMAFMPHRLRRWPFAGRIAFCEQDWRGMGAWHVFHDWRHLGTRATPDDLPEPAREPGPFDLDLYKLLVSVLDRPPRGLKLVELDRA
jgi:DNA polymerase III subunit epsilon